MRRRRVDLRWMVLAVIVLFGTGLVWAQSGGPYELVSSTVDAGGVQESSAGDYEVSSTSGQPDAGVMSGGSYEINGGFWPTVVDPFIFSDGFEEGNADSWSSSVGQVEKK